MSHILGSLLKLFHPECKNFICKLPQVCPIYLTLWMLLVSSAAALFYTGRYKIFSTTHLPRVKFLVCNLNFIFMKFFRQKQCKKIHDFIVKFSFVNPPETFQNFQFLTKFRVSTSALPIWFVVLNISTKVIFQIVN